MRLKIKISASVRILALSSCSLWPKPCSYSPVSAICFFSSSDEHFHGQHKHNPISFTCEILIGPGAKLAGFAGVFIRDIFIFFTRSAGPTATHFSFTNHLVQKLTFYCSSINSYIHADPAANLIFKFLFPNRRVFLNFNIPFHYVFKGKMWQNL